MNVGAPYRRGKASASPIGRWRFQNHAAGVLFCVDKQQRHPELENSITYEAWLAVLGLASVGIGVYELLHPRTERTFLLRDWIDLGIVLVFNIDFIRESLRRGSFRAYARENWWEIPTLIPI